MIPARLARLLIRLNPKSVPMTAGGGGGGTPSLTAQDVAAALGAAGRRSEKDRVAVDVLCMRHWPELFDGAEVTNTRQFREVTTKRTIERIGKEAKTTKAVERIPIAHRAPTRSARRLTYLIAVRAAKKFYARYKTDEKMQQEFEKRMPIHPAFWLKLALSVVAEYRAPNYCQTCKGNEFIKVLVDDPQSRHKVKLVEEMCPTCLGSGTMSWSYKRRAKSLHIRAETYRMYIHPIHEGEIALLRALEVRGAMATLHFLG